MSPAIARKISFRLLAGALGSSPNPWALVATLRDKATHVRLLLFPLESSLFDPPLPLGRYNSVYLGEFSARCACREPQTGSSRDSNEGGRDLPLECRRQAVFDPQACGFARRTFRDLHRAPPRQVVLEPMDNHLVTPGNGSGPTPSQGDEPGPADVAAKKRAHRGPDPRDALAFGPLEPAGLWCAAVADLSGRLSRGYAIVSALKLAGDRWCLTERQRQAVRRAACSDQARERRQARQVAPADLSGQGLLIDGGFNVLTTIEVGVREARSCSFAGTKPAATSPASR